MLKWLKKFRTKKYNIRDISGIHKKDTIPIDTEEDAMEIILSLGMSGKATHGEIKIDENGKRVLVVESITDLRDGNE